MTPSSISQSNPLIAPPAMRSKACQGPSVPDWTGELPHMLQVEYENNLGGSCRPFRRGRLEALLTRPSPHPHADTVGCSLRPLGRIAGLQVAVGSLGWTFRSRIRAWCVSLKSFGSFLHAQQIVILLSPQGVRGPVGQGIGSLFSFLLGGCYLPLLLSHRRSRYSLHHSEGCFRAFGILQTRCRCLQR